MIKVILVATAALVGTASLAPAAPFMARSHMMMKKKTVAANGRCGGVSYGTGARRCGSRSGGPAGGNSSRN